MSATVPMLRVTNLHKSFVGVPVLNGIDLQLDRGRVMVLIGASGSGKSTFLRCINRLERPDAGTVELDGELIGYRVGRGPKPRLRELPPRAIERQRAEIGMVFQHFNLFPHMTALENIVEAPLALRRMRRPAARTEALALLRQVGLEKRGDNYPRQLSGGQQQRVAIARALAMRPKLMLLDEPTSALDPELVGEVMQVIRELAAGGMTMVAVTHELDFARELADVVAFVDGGRILEEGPPARVLGKPDHARTEVHRAGRP
jgi:polar amino acid transport system ATP-binding protein